MMKFLGIVLLTTISLSAFAGTTMTCTWSDSDNNNSTFQIDVDLNKNTASALLIDGISPGTPAKYDCQVQPSCSAALSSMTTLICMGPQMAPGVGQVITSFMIDLVNKTAATQNTLVRPTGLTSLSSFPATQCN